MGNELADWKSAMHRCSRDQKSDYNSIHYYHINDKKHQMRRDITSAGVRCPDAETMTPDPVLGLPTPPAVAAAAASAAAGETALAPASRQSTPLCVTSKVVDLERERCIV